MRCSVHRFGGLEVLRHSAAWPAASSSGRLRKLAKDCWPRRPEYRLSAGMMLGSRLKPGFERRPIACPGMPLALPEWRSDARVGQLIGYRSRVGTPPGDRRAAALRSAAHRPRPWPLSPPLDMAAAHGRRLPCTGSCRAGRRLIARPLEKSSGSFIGLSDRIAIGLFWDTIFPRKPSWQDLDADGEVTPIIEIE